jgi:hypothetical protein
MADDNGPRADALAGLWVWMSLAFLPLLLLCLYLGRGAVLVAVVLPTPRWGSPSLRWFARGRIGPLSTAKETRSFAWCCRRGRWP